MKKIITLLMIGYCHISLSQSSEIFNIEQEEVNMLEDINFSELKTGILYDRVSGNADLPTFNSSKKVANYKLFRQALYELNESANEELFLSSDDLDKAVKNDFNDNYVDLGFINTDFEQVHINLENPSRGGYIIKNNRLIRQPRNKPFIRRNITMATPLKQVVKGRSIVFRYQNNRVFQNAKEKIKDIKIDFGDGRTISILMKNGQVLSNYLKAGYQTGGGKIITFYITKTDGEEIVTTASLYVIAPSQSSRMPGCGEQGVSPLKKKRATIGFTGYEEGDAEIFGEIEYKIFYRNNEGGVNSLKKPIIIVDGFDPQDKRRIQDCDCQEDVRCARENLKIEVSNYPYTVSLTYDPDKHESIEELMKIKGSNKNFIDELRDDGFDVIIVNQSFYKTLDDRNVIDGGADYIERNAFALIELIKDVNRELSTSNSNEELVVIGPSMGGLITRYALSYMEKKLAATQEEEWEHNTRLWVSLDSPHLGASIPIGTQTLIHLLNFYEGSPETKDFVNKSLNSPAARQMLIDRIEKTTFRRKWLVKTRVLTGIYGYFNGKTRGQGYNQNLGDPFYKRFYNALANNGLPNSKGYPQNLRKIALTNGSLSGSKEYVLPDQTSTDHNEFGIDSEKSLHLKAFARNVFSSNLANMEAYFQPSFNNKSRVARFSSSKLFKKIDTKINHRNRNNRGNLDIIPGGYFDTQQQIADAVTDASLGTIGGILNVQWETRKLKPINSFISTYSALGHLNPDQSWASSLDRNLACSNEIPFDSYFGEARNTSHISFNTKSRDWLLEEINGNEQIPNYPGGEPNLIGSKFVCSNQAYTYSFEQSCGLPEGNPIWTTSSNIIITLSNSNAVMITSQSSSSESAWIKATFVNGESVKKDLWLNTPAPNYTSINGIAHEIYTSRIYDINVAPNNSASQYKWVITSSSTSSCDDIQKPRFKTPQGYTSTYISSNNNVSFTSGRCPGFYIIHCYAINSCGIASTPIDSRFVKIKDPYNDPCRDINFTVFPNPVTKGNTELNISRVIPIECRSQANSKTTINNTYNLRIYTMSGIMLYNKTVVKEDITINDLNLKTGMYIIQIKSKGENLKTEILAVK